MRFFSFSGLMRSREVVLLGLVLIWGAGATQARIGDTPDQMGARMIQPNLGKMFSWPKDMPPRERARAQKENPLTPFAHLLPGQGEEWQEQIFWKSAIHRQLSYEDGWRVHVYYLRGRSVVELYRRVGEPLNEFEINAILGRMRGNLTWRRIPKKEQENPADTVLGYDYELGEEGTETLRARRQGDWLIVYHKRFDELLMARKARWAETESQRKAQQAAEQERTAPVSVEGF